MKKFDRKINLRLGTTDYTNEILDIDFTYDFDNDSDTNNVTEISIWNLSQESRDEIRLGRRVILNAGYGEDIGVISIGEIGDFETEYHGVDVETKVYASDNVNLWGSRIDKTYENLTAEEVVEDILQIAGVRIGKVQVVNNITYDKIVFRDSLKNILGKVAKDTNSKFFIKNTNGYFVPEGYVDKTLVNLDKNSGLLNSPQKTTIREGESDKEKEGWKISCMLEYRLGVNSHVEVKSKTFNGRARVVRGTHNSDFTTEIEVLPI